MRGDIILDPSLVRKLPKIARSVIDHKKIKKLKRPSTILNEFTKTVGTSFGQKGTMLLREKVSTVRGISKRLMPSGFQYIRVRDGLKG